MKPYFFFFALALAACDKPSPPAPQKPVPDAQSAFDLEKPADTKPPVETLPYEEGYAAGIAAGEAAAKVRDSAHPRERPRLPGDEELSVHALEAAGADARRGPKWQRGYISGFKDGFVRIAERRK